MERPREGDGSAQQTRVFFCAPSRWDRLSKVAPPDRAESGSCRCVPPLAGWCPTPRWATLPKFPPAHLNASDRHLEQMVEARQARDRHRRRGVLGRETEPRDHAPPRACRLGRKTATAEWWCDGALGPLHFFVFCFGGPWSHCHRP